MFKLERISEREMTEVQNKHPEHYLKTMNGEVRRTAPKLRGKAAVKAAKRKRQSK